MLTPRVKPETCWSWILLLSVRICQTWRAKSQDESRRSIVTHRDNKRDSWCVGASAYKSRPLQTHWIVTITHSYSHRIAFNSIYPTNLNDINSNGHTRRPSSPLDDFVVTIRSPAIFYLQSTSWTCPNVTRRSNRAWRRSSMHGSHYQTTSKYNRDRPSQYSSTLTLKIYHSRWSHRRLAYLQSNSSRNSSHSAGGARSSRSGQSHSGSAYYTNYSNSAAQGQYLRNGNWVRMTLDTSFLSEHYLLLIW